MVLPRKETFFCSLLSLRNSRFINFSQTVRQRVITLKPQEIFAQNPFYYLQSYHSIPWRDSISRPIATVSSVAGVDETTRPRRQGFHTRRLSVQKNVRVSENGFSVDLIMLLFSSTPKIRRPEYSSNDH
jgi:hypothetical protein